VLSDLDDNFNPTGSGGDFGVFDQWPDSRPEVYLSVVQDEFNSSDEFNSFYTSQNRRILLHRRLWTEFVWIKFDDNATYKQALSHRSLKGRATLHYLLKSPLPVEPCLACIRAAVLVEWHLRLFAAKMKTNTKKHKRNVFGIAHQCLWHLVCEKWKDPVFGIRSWRRLSVDLRPRLLLPTSFISMLVTLYPMDHSRSLAEFML